MSVSVMQYQQWPSLDVSTKRKGNKRWGQPKPATPTPGPAEADLEWPEVAPLPPPGLPPWRERSASPPGRAEAPAPKIPVLCMYHARGRCTHGSGCRFAHGQEEFEGIADTLLASRNAVYKTKLCRFNEAGRCRSGSFCFFAHGEDELKGRPGAEARLEEEEEDDERLPETRSGSASEGTGESVEDDFSGAETPSLGPVYDPTEAMHPFDPGDNPIKAVQAFDSVDDWSILPSWLCDDCSDADGDTDNCSTASEVMNTGVKHVSSDSSEEDDHSSVLSSSQDGTLVEAACESATDQAPIITHLEKLMRASAEKHVQANEVIEDTDKETEDLEEHDLTCIRVHRWDTTQDKWVLDVLDLTEVQVPDKFWHEHIPQQQDFPFSSSTDGWPAPVQTIKLEDTIPRCSLKQALWESNAAKTSAPTPSRTPLRTSAALFVPQYEPHSRGTGKPWWKDHDRWS